MSFGPSAGWLTGNSDGTTRGTGRSGTAIGCGADFVGGVPDAAGLEAGAGVVVAGLTAGWESGFAGVADGSSTSSVGAGERGPHAAGKRKFRVTDLHRHQS